VEVEVVVVVVGRQVVVEGFRRVRKEIGRRWRRRAMIGRAGLRAGLVCGLKAFSVAGSLESGAGPSRVRCRRRERLFYMLHLRTEGLGWRRGGGRMLAGDSFDICDGPFGRGRASGVRRLRLFWRRFVDGAFLLGIMESWIKEMVRRV
jgi:hypothetical protein